jgi:uncharacterized RDD family membrane protein YckC
MLSAQSIQDPEEKTAAFAGPIRRLMALMYDSLLLLGVLFVATLIPAVVTHKLHATQGDKVYDLPPLFQGAGFSLYLLVITLFFGYFWRKNGQTLGMQAWRLKVVAADGQKPSWLQCIIRGVVAIASLACLGFGYFWVLIDKQHLAWQDRASNTKIILLPKKK